MIRSLVFVAGLGVGMAPAAEVGITTFGSNPVPIGAGARALGMGGAFAAIADDATAATWNPAGMAQLEDIEVGLSAGWYLQRVDDGEADTDHDQALDHASAVFPFYRGLQQSLGLAWQREYDLTTSIGVDQTIVDGLLTRESASDYERTGAYSSWGLSYAVEAWPGVKFGVTGKIWDDEFTAHSQADHEFTNLDRSRVGVLVTTTDLDLATEEEVVEGYSVVIGALYRPVPWLDLALVVRPGYDLRLHKRTSGRRTVTSSLDIPSAPPPTVTEERVADRWREVLQQPDRVTVAGAWRIDDHHTVALDLTWTDWSDYAIERDGERFSPVNAALEPSAHDDGVSVRLGYEQVMILPRLVVVPRLGLLYEQLPSIEPVDDLGAVDEVDAATDSYLGLTLGMSAFRRRVSYDLGAEVRHGRDVGTGLYVPPDRDADITTATVRAGFTYFF